VRYRETFFFFDRERLLGVFSEVYARYIL